ncbi:MAG: general secretion pathway protein GspK [Deltaproteobacteria bacterium]|nr:general secretion pathway protein GspK [Deltaproteobacteria bacterium]
MTDFDYNYLDKDGKMVFAGKGERVNIPREFDLGGGKVSYAIIDEESKININTASRDLLWNLMKALGIEIAARDVIADSILDWRDTNSDYHLNGAESDDFYLKLSHPYEAKNGSLDSYEELLLVKGITPDIFYGAKDIPQGINFANLQTNAETKTPEDYNSDFSGIHNYITSFGAHQININTASEKALEARLGTAVSQQIISQRKDGMVFQQPPSYGGGGIVKSTTFTIIAKGYAADEKAFHQIKAVVEKRAGQKQKPEIRIRYWNDNI